MLNDFFSSIIENGAFSGSDFIYTTFTALVCGMIISGAYVIKNKCSKSFAITLVLLPAIVEVVIILVNGNIGTGIAVAGAFSLVKFRSAPGKGQEITSIFLDMAVGLASGMGHIGVAFFFTLIISLLNVVLNISGFGGKGESYRKLKVTVPYNVDYEKIFDDIFKKYAVRFSYDEIKTGGEKNRSEEKQDISTGVYKICINISLRKNASIKNMIDELKNMNGNLDVCIGKISDNQDNL